MIVYNEDPVRQDPGVAGKLQRVYWPDMGLNTHPPMMATVKPIVRQPQAQLSDQPATGSKRRAECMEDVEMEDANEASPSKKSKTLFPLLPRSTTPARSSSADSTPPRSPVLPDAAESNATTQADEADGIIGATEDLLIFTDDERHPELSSLSAGISLLSLTKEKEAETSM